MHSSWLCESTGSWSSFKLQDTEYCKTSDLGFHVYPAVSCHSRASGAACETRVVLLLSIVPETNYKQPYMTATAINSFRGLSRL